MKENLELSVIIPITEKNRQYNVEELHYLYKKNVERTKKTYEFIYVLDGNFPEEFQVLQDLKKKGECLKILKLAKWFGESIALSAGFENSDGKLILTLPAYPQIDEEEIPKIINAVNGHDMIIARRWPRMDGFINKVQNQAFHRLVKITTGTNFNDLGSGVRIFRRQVGEEVQIYGDQHRFFPLLAKRYGFKVAEINVRQSPKDAFSRVYSFGIYLRRMLDLLTVFFLIKFTKKPLRFFGLSGVTVFLIGAFLSFYLFIQRMFFHVPLADRPIILLALLLIVLGIQIFAIGLIGEIIIFTHARELKEYTIEQVVN